MKIISGLKNKILNRDIDYYSLVFVCILCVSGLVWILDASSAILKGDQLFFYFNKQSLYLLVGIVSAFFMYVFFEYFEKFIFPIFILSLIILIAMLIPGVTREINGTHRWINLFGFDLQISEFIKIIIIIYLSKLVVKGKEKINSLVHKDKNSISHYFKQVFVPFLTIATISSLLILFQRDLGTTVIIFVICIIILLISSKSFTQILLSIGFTLLGLVVSLLSISTYEYRLGRLDIYKEIFIHGNLENISRQDRLSKGYQAEQMLIAIGSGGMWGVGFTGSSQKYYYLVDQTSYTDNIFAVISEESGLVGAGAYVLIYLLLYCCMIRRVWLIEDEKRFLMGFSFATLVILQASMNICANLSIIPMKGLTLPFISYGGSSLISVLIGYGMYLKITTLNYNFTK